MSQRSSSRVTRSQSAQGEPLVPPVDNPDRPSVARSDNATSLSALREQVLQMTTEATDAIHARVSIPGSYADPDETIQAEPTIIVGEGNPNESTATAADIIGGRSIPRTTVESVSDPDESRLSEDIGRTPDTTEPVATQVETAQTTGPEHFWNARASISPRGIISVRRRVPVDPTAGIEDQIDPVPPYAPNPLELPTGRYGPTNIPREERHLYSAHPLTGVRTRSQASNAIEAPIPQRPIQTSKPFILETDASGIAIGAILSQRGEDGYLHPVAYLSKSYNDAQRNYDTANKELLAIVESLKHWRIYLEGTILPVTVFTDHRNLERWKNAETFNRRHARWHMELASFNFEIHYRPGKMSNKPDALSRRHDHEDIPNPQQIMINAERFKGFKANIEIDIISMIRESLSDDESLTTLIESTKKKEDLPPSIRKQYDKYAWKEDLLWYEGRIVIPENKEIRLAILEMHHDNPIAGHQGQARTLELISRRYYWPAMKQQVNRFVETCEICQRSKGHKHYTPQKPLPIPQKPWEDIAYDFIVKLPESQGMDSILVVIDRFSRQAHFIPCLESTNAEGVADLFIKEVWKLHGLPKTTVSDRGPTFNSQFLKALYTKLGINPKFSTAFHPETDGITERTNQWLEGFLRSFCNYRQDDWVRWLPIAEFCHNNQVNSATGKTAFETIYGLHPRWDLVDLEVNAPNAADMADSMQEIWDEVIASMEFYRSKESDPKREYKVGDKVWLVGQNITTRRPSKKLDNKKLGPFVISEKISSHAYRLELPKTMRTHNVFHINLLAPFTEDKDFHRRQARPPPIVTEEGEEEYEVDHVVAWEQRKNGLYYQIRWKGYDPIEDTMERAEKIAELPQVMEDLLKRHPKAPVPKNYKHPGKEYKRTEGKASNLTTSYSSSPPNNQSQLTNSPNPFSLPWPPSAPTSLPRPPPSATIPVTLGSSSTTPPNAIRRCDSFIRSADYAKSLDPGLTLDYIPMAERWNCRWLATHTLQCPKRGNLYWVGKGPRPESDRAMQATKLFVIEEWVGSEVEHLVKEVQKVKKMSWYEDYTRTKDRNDRLIKKSINQFSTPHLIKRLEEWENQGKEKAVPKWVENSTEWWFRLSDIEEMKKEWMGSIGDKGQKMAIVARVVEEWCQAPDISKSYQEVLKEISFGEVVELAEKERWSKRELLDWLDQRAWDKGNEDLSVDMADLLLEPLDEDEEWVKLKEEVWGAEAPNGAGVYHPKDTEEF
ncbi:Retrotransposable element Tf2 protein [Ceratobasidium sp. AG-Ba]|nr:Retrotransposable element Tf2 protein [Ceratobasidium sp. AG-Ba]